MNSYRHLSVAILVLALIAVLVTGSEGIPETFCRRSEEVARCVQKPLIVGANVKWCPYRVCAFSYVPAEECPKDFEKSATHKCSVRKVSWPVWKCVHGVSHKKIMVPVGCKGKACKDEVKACACVQHSPSRNIFLPQYPVQTTC